MLSGVAAFDKRCSSCCSFHALRFANGFLRPNSASFAGIVAPKQWGQAPKRADTQAYPEISSLDEGVHPYPICIAVCSANIDSVADHE